MNIRGLSIACGLLLAGGVAAQSAVAPQTQQDDRWTAPATASSASFHADQRLPGRTDASVFQFKRANRRGPADLPPPQANDKAAVMGKPRPWQNGRPPLDCAAQPRDPACR